MPYLAYLLSPQELTADDNRAINDINDHLKMQNITMNGKSAFPDLSSEMENSDHRHDSAHQIKQTGLNEDHQSGNHPRKITFQPESRDNDLAENEMKINSDSAVLKDFWMSCIRHDEVVTATQSDKAYRNMTKHENVHSPAPGSQDSNSIDNAINQQHISEVTGVPSSIEKPGTKDVKSMSTQTEECNREEVEDFGSPLQRPVVLHASTQTNGEQTVQSEKKEEQNEERNKSHPFSPAPESETERLLFSGSFPIPADPAHLAERIRRNRNRMSAAYDDTEYEPYGLPEVVMKGV